MTTSRSRAPHRFAGSILLSLVAGALACAGIHASTLEKYQGRVLARASEDGATRLDIEMAHDSAIRGWIEQAGKPDYLYVKSRDEVALYYVEEPRSVLFVRTFLDSKSTVSVQQGISPQVSQFFSSDDRLRLTDAGEP
jgi:hypothetical protein